MRLIILLLITSLTAGLADAILKFKSNTSFNKANIEAMSIIAKSKNSKFFNSPNFGEEFKKLLYETRRNIPSYKKHKKFERLLHFTGIALWLHIYALAFIFLKRLQYMKKHEYMCPPHCPLPYMGGFMMVVEEVKNQTNEKSEEEKKEE